MAGKRKSQHKHFNTMFVLGRTKTEQMKGRDKTMLKKKTEYGQEVKKE